MAQQILDNGSTFLTQRTEINSNFTELYGRTLLQFAPTVVTDGVTDNSAAINAALAAAGTAGGGVVLLPAGVIAIGSALDIKWPRVILQGVGIDAQHDAGPPTIRTELKATFAGTMLRIRTPYAAEMAGVAQQKYWGAGARGLFLNCNSIATRAMVVDSVSGVDIDVFGQGCVGTTLYEVTCGVTGTDLAEAADVQFSRMVFRGRQIDSTAEKACHILTLQGSTNANVSLNRGPLHGITVFCQHWDGHALNAVKADNNDIVAAGFRPGGGTGNLVYGYGLTATNDGFYANTITFASGAGPIFVQGTDTPGVTAVQNSILNLDQANGTPNPTAGTGSNWDVRDTRGTYTGGSYNKMVVAGSVSDAFAQLANLGTSSLRVHNVGDNHVVLADGAGNAWSINITSSDGNLRVVRTGGTGIVTLNENVRLNNRVGFNGTTPIARPTVTGSRGGNAALDSLLTALANYGLITNSTSA